MIGVGFVQHVPGVGVGVVVGVGECCGAGMGVAGINGSGGWRFGDFSGKDGFGLAAVMIGRGIRPVGETVGEVRETGGL